MDSFRKEILDRSASGIYIYDLEKGTNIYINGQYTSLTGYTLEKINKFSAQEFFELFHPDDQKPVGEHMEEVINSGEGEIIEILYRFKKLDGNWMWCLSKDSVFKRNDGKSVQLMGTFFDVTRLIQTKQM